jgi:hypothetical protein
MLSSLCLGTIVTSSISHKKATSDGTSPGGRGKAMAVRDGNDHGVQAVVRSRIALTGRTGLDGHGAHN